MSDKPFTPKAWKGATVIQPDPEFANLADEIMRRAELYTRLVKALHDIRERFIAVGECTDRRN